MGGLHTCDLSYSIYIIVMAIIEYVHGDLMQLIFLRKSDCLGCAVLLCLV